MGNSVKLPTQNLVEYKDFAENCNTFDILLWSGKGLFSDVTRLGTGIFYF